MVTQITLLIPDPTSVGDSRKMVSVSVETDLGSARSDPTLTYTLASKANSGQYLKARIFTCAPGTGLCRSLGTWSMSRNLCSSCQSYRSVVLLQEVSKCVRELLGSLRPPQALVVQGPPAHVLQGGERS